MPAKGETSPIILIPIKPNPRPYQRMTSISADRPSGPHEIFAQPHTLRIQAGNRSSPEKLHSHSCGVVSHNPVERHSAHTDSISFGEARVDVKIAADEADSAEGMRVLFWNADSYPGERSDAVWHQALAASLVNGRLRSVRNGDFESAPARCNCRRQSRRSAADYKYVCVVLHIARKLQ